MMLNWVVLVSFLLNIPLICGCERLLPNLLSLPTPNDIDIASLIEYTSIAIMPVFFVVFVSFLCYECSWRRSFRKNDDERWKAVRIPTQIWWACSSLGYIVGQVSSIMIFSANLFVDVPTEIISIFDIHGVTLRTCVIAVVALGSLASSLGAGAYCLRYWMMNEADAAIGAALSKR